jgi:hypothetical protein
LCTGKITRGSQVECHLETGKITCGSQVEFHLEKWYSKSAT